MGLPRIVVIDDSEAIQAFMRAVLASHYAITTASNGVEGLALCRRARPQLVLLDLSMPGMTGEEVLAEIQADAQLAGTPVVIVTSERARAKACMSRGASAYLVKPLRADDVGYVVEQSLAKARTEVARQSMPVLPIGIGRFEMAVPLEEVREVVWMTLVSPLPAGPAYLTSFVEARGEPVCVLDLAARFGIEHGEPLVERKLVIVEHGGTKLALCVDRVHDPEDVAPSEIGASPLPDLDASALVAMVKTARGPVPVIQAHALLSRGLVRRLPELLREAGP